MNTKMEKHGKIIGYILDVIIYNGFDELKTFTETYESKSEFETSFSALLNRYGIANYSDHMLDYTNENYGLKYSILHRHVNINN